MVLTLAYNCVRVHFRRLRETASGIPLVRRVKLLGWMEKQIQKYMKNLHPDEIRTAGYADEMGENCKDLEDRENLEDVQE